jgi:hypothetical protein
VNDPTHPRTAAQDAFGLAVLLWQLFFDGVHPFLGRNSTIEENIKRGEWPHRSRTVKPSPFAGKLDSLHPKLRSLFLQAFQKGLKDPGRRPAAAMWRQALEEVEAEIYPAAQKPSQPSQRAQAWTPTTGSVGLVRWTLQRIDAVLNLIAGNVSNSLLVTSALVLLGIVAFLAFSFIKGW